MPDIKYNKSKIFYKISFLLCNNNYFMKFYNYFDLYTLNNLFCIDNKIRNKYLGPIIKDMLNKKESIFDYLKTFILFQNKKVIEVCLEIFYNYHENYRFLVDNNRDNRYSILTFQFYTFYNEKNFEAIKFLLINYGEKSLNLSLDPIYDYVSKPFSDQLYYKLMINCSNTSECKSNTRPFYMESKAPWPVYNYFQKKFIDFYKKYISFYDNYYYYRELINIRQNIKKRRKKYDQKNIKSSFDK